MYPVLGLITGDKTSFSKTSVTFYLDQFVICVLSFLILEYLFANYYLFPSTEPWSTYFVVTEYYLPHGL